MNRRLIAETITTSGHANFFKDLFSDQSNKVRFLNEGRRSFPSGHASSTFAGLGLASFFLAGQMKTFDGSFYIHKLVIFLLPFVASCFVGLTRIWDHRHHWQDVLVGSLIGIASATAIYFFYFPSLASAKCDEPRDTRFKKLAEDEEVIQSRPPSAFKDSSIV